MKSGEGFFTDTWSRNLLHLGSPYLSETLFFGDKNLQFSINYVFIIISSEFAFTSFSFLLLFCIVQRKEGGL